MFFAKGPGIAFQGMKLWHAGMLAERLSLDLTICIILKKAVDDATINPAFHAIAIGERWVSAFATKFHAKSGLAGDSKIVPIC